MFGLVVSAILCACSGERLTKSYECQSGNSFSVDYIADSARFVYAGRQYELAATTPEKDVYKRDDAELRKTANGVSLRIGDQVVVFGCQPATDAG